MSFSTSGTPASTLKVTDSAHGSSSIEPSPASTYGSSVASNVGDAQPMTPMNDVILPGMANLTLSDNYKSLQKAQISFGYAAAADDDVFANDSRPKGKGRAAPKPDRVDKIRELADWRSESSSSSGSPSVKRGRANPKLPAGPSEEDPRQLAFQEYASDDGSYQNFEPAHRQDAQAIYPPSSCVFVANLLRSETDEALEATVTEAFREYGPVYVKIRRDPKLMPFAFCQYTNDNSAERAIREGSGRVINGRACRVEKAKAHRLFFIERKYGPTITTTEAYSVLQNFGHINFCRPAAPIERNQYNLNEGVMVQYELYNDGQAAMQAYRNDDVYKVRSMASLSSISRGSPVPPNSEPAVSRYTKLCDIARRSIHVSNLAADITQNQAKEHFQQCGLIIRISIHCGPSKLSPNQLYAFAFVEFDSQASAEMAINRLNGSCLGGKIIRVVQKDTRERRAPAGPDGTPGYVNTPTLQSPVQQQFFQTPSPAAPYMGVGPPSATQWTIYNGWYCYWSIDTATGVYCWIPYCPVSSSPYSNSGWYGSAADPTMGSPLAVQTTDNYMAPAHVVPQAPVWTNPPDIVQTPVWTTTPAIVPQQQVSPVGKTTQDETQDEDRSATPTPADQATVPDCSKSV